MVREMTQTTDRRRTRIVFFLLFSLFFFLFSSLSLMSNYSDLPGTVPLRFNLKGEPVGFGGKQTLSSVLIVQGGLTLVFSLLAFGIPKFEKYGLLNTPQKERCLKLPEEKRRAYRENLQESLLFCSAGLNLFITAVLRSNIEVALGRSSTISPKVFLPLPLILLGFLFVYLPKMLRIPEE